jgi:hypothetical protein
MAVIYHLIVGTDSLVPTEAQLQEINEEFRKPVPVFTLPVKIVELPLGFGVDCRVVVSAYSKNWTPTDKEISDLRAMFTFALTDTEDSVIATRYGVKAQVIECLNSTKSEEKT